MVLSIKAFGVVQKGVGEGQAESRLYVGVMKAGEILGRERVDTWSENNPEGYQRPLVPARTSDVVHYLTKEEGFFPTSVVLAVREKELLQFNVEEANNDGGLWGTLVIPDEATLWMVDGQHRLYGIRAAMERGHESLKDYTLPVTILDGVDRFDEMRHFYIINTRQRKMPTDVVDQHLLQMRREQGPEMMPLVGRRVSTQQKEYLRALAAEVTHMLNDGPGVWTDAIQVPGAQRMARHRQKFHAIVASLDPVMRDNYLITFPPDDVARLLNNYWSAILETWQEAFENPGEHRIQETPGIYSLHMIFPDVVARCRDAHDFSSGYMKQVILDLGLANNFWHKEEGDRMTIGTGMGSIRVLAQYLRERLPRLELPGA